MGRCQFTWIRRVGSSVAGFAVLFVGLAAAQAQTVAQSTPGRIDFVGADLPTATVEINLSQAMFNDLFGLGDAALMGVIEALSGASGDSDATKLAAEKLAEGRELLQLVKNVVQEARVRVYEDFSENEVNAIELADRFAGQLKQGAWENVIRVREGNNSVHISILRAEGAIRGVFVVAADHNDVVLANVVGDISPENVKKLTASATKIGLENGLQEEIERNIRRHVR